MITSDDVIRRIEMYVGRTAPMEATLSHLSVG